MRVRKHRTYSLLPLPFIGVFVAPGDTNGRTNERTSVPAATYTNSPTPKNQPTGGSGRKSWVYFSLCNVSRSLSLVVAIMRIYCWTLHVLNAFRAHSRIASDACAMCIMCIYEVVGGVAISRVFPANAAQCLTAAWLRQLLMHADSRTLIIWYDNWANARARAPRYDAFYFALMHAKHAGDHAGISGVFVCVYLCVSCMCIAYTILQYTCTTRSRQFIVRVGLHRFFVMEFL